MITVEACLRQEAAGASADLVSRVHALVRGSGIVTEGQLLKLSADATLVANLRHVRVSDVPGGAADGSTVRAAVHVHPLFEEEAAEEAADDNDAESSVAFQMWTLPAAEFDGLWETLLYEEEVKPQLLRYVSTAMRFSDLGVDSRIIGWNRVVLLHGPPGTGKTSLCKGLAQKLAIQMSSVYAQAAHPTPPPRAENGSKCPKPNPRIFTPVPTPPTPLYLPPRRYLTRHHPLRGI